MTRGAKCRWSINCLLSLIDKNNYLSDAVTTMFTELRGYLLLTKLMCPLLLLLVDYFHCLPVAETVFRSASELTVIRRCLTKHRLTGSSKFDFVQWLDFTVFFSSRDHCSRNFVFCQYVCEVKCLSPVQIDFGLYLMVFLSEARIEANWMVYSHGISLGNRLLDFRQASYSSCTLDAMERLIFREIVHCGRWMI